MGSDSQIDYASNEALAGQFINWTEDAVKEMRQILVDLPEENKRGDAAVQRLYDLTHNIKGMGSSFSFDLMTSVGLSLCGYMKALDEADRVSKKVMDAHVRAFEVVLQHRITGDGGTQGQALNERLQAIISQVG